MQAIISHCVGELFSLIMAEQKANNVGNDVGNK